MRKAIDFAGLAAALLERADVLVPRWLSAGFERAGRWYCGDFDGGAGESANVDLRTGTWIDNGGGHDDKGGDLISLYARIHNLNNGQAAHALMQELGWERPHEDAGSGYHPTAAIVQAPARAQPDDGGEAPGGAHEPAAAPTAAPVAPKRTQRWRALRVVPKHAPPAKFEWAYKDRSKGDEWVKLVAKRHWAYEFEGELYGYVARFERVNSDGEITKDTLPLTWCEDTEDPRGGQRWHWKQWEAPRPLYVPATLLSHDLSLPVVVVEGEKCAEAGHRLLGHEFDFVTWPGGCKTWALANWGWLMGRKVYLWPDVDAQHERLTKAEKDAGVDAKTKPLLPEHKQPGMQAMVHVGTVLQADHGCDVFMCRVPKPGAVGDGWDVADAIESGWDADTVRAFIRGAVVFKSPNDEARSKAEGYKPLPLAGADQGEEDTIHWWRRYLIETSGKERSTVKPVRENVVLALDGITLDDGRLVPGCQMAAGVIAFNEFTNDVIKLKPAPWGTGEGRWEEHDELELGNWLTRQHSLPPMSRQTLEEAVSMVARRHHFHPVRERFAALRGKWDRVKRLKMWMAHCTRQEGVLPDDDPLGQYLARVGAWTIMAIVARVMNPGCKHDYMLILEGTQGKGKSTLAATLGMEWFADTGLVLGDKDSYQNLQGVLVYEWGELDSLTRAEVTKVKQFISSQKDRFRASFDRRPKDYPRQVVFIGTTNESHYLSDPTGNRRFWPVRVTKDIDLAWLRENRDQLFAEAIHYLDKGQRFHPTRDEQAELFDPQQQERTVESTLESAIRRTLYDEDQKPPLNGRNWTLVDECTLAELLTQLGISVDKQSAVLAKQASAVLGRLGWERARGTARGADKVRPWVYRRPKGEGVSASESSAAGGGVGGPAQGHESTDEEDLDAIPF